MPPKCLASVSCKKNMSSAAPTHDVIDLDASLDDIADMLKKDDGSFEVDEDEDDDEGVTSIYFIL